MLLRNSEQDGEKALPITEDQAGHVKLYVEVFTGEAEESAESTGGLQETFRRLDDSIEIVQDQAEATHSYLWVIPSLSWSQDDTGGDPPSVLLRKDQDTGIDHERIMELQEQIDTNILSINFTNPWLVNEIEPGADAVLSTFNTTPEAVIGLIRGEYASTGQMPFTVPASQESVEQNASDVPGYAEDPDCAYVDSEANTWDLRHGLGYED
ncbi:hypothetical protein [Nocardiopsis xinjiangensis]|uniref:hypothetical protein n=1 Tax=Nocardiopsis xinjiangensis TaxID=124285 RepID=UPI000475CD33|nr:hypothetical protein [Nocardiopsis xinjiangensis]